MVVGIVPLRNKFLLKLVCLCSIFFASASAQADASSALQKKLFNGVQQPACQIVSRGPGVKLQDVDKSLNDFVQAVFTKLQEGKGSGFKPFFHPKLRVKSDIGERIMAIFGKTYRKPWQFSVYRVYALYSPQADKVEVACPEDQVTINGPYGYKVQFGIWLQIMGQNELGRIFLTVSPRDDKWFITGWHFQQWSQSGKDFEAWSKAGTDAFNAKKPVLAHMYFDTAQKLLFGGDFVTFDVKKQIIAARDQSMTKETWLEKTQELLKSKDDIYIGTVMAEGGVGILLRERVPTGYATNELQKRCLAKGKTFIKEGWLPPNSGGLRCEFVLPGEDESREGKLGSLFYTHADLLQKKL